MKKAHFVIETEAILKLSKEILEQNEKKIDKVISILEKKSEKFLSKPKPKKPTLLSYIGDFFSNRTIEQLDRKYGFSSPLDKLEAMGIANCANNLVTHLEKSSFIHLQNRASLVAIQLLFKECFHYPHMVAPLMVTHAKIAKKQGDKEKFILVCQSILEYLNNHSFLDDEFLNDLQEKPLNLKSEDDYEIYLAIEALHFAANHLIKEDEATPKLKTLNIILNDIVSVTKQ